MGGRNLPAKQVQIAASAARAATASFTGSDIHNPGYRTAHVYMDVTADPATASLTLTIQGKDLTSGDYYDLVASAAITGVTTGPNRYSVGDGVETVTNVSLRATLPKVWRVIVAGSNTDSMTYSISADLLP